MSIRERLIRRYGEKEAERKDEKEKNETRDEVRRLRKVLAPKNNTGGKVVKMFSKGFMDIGKSLSEPYSKKRPRIANLPRSKPDIAATSEMDLSALRRDDVFGESIRRK